MIEEKLNDIASAEAALAQVNNAPNSTLFTTAVQTDGSLKVTVRPQLEDERMVALLLSEAKGAIDALTVDDVRINVRQKIKQFVWDTAQAISPDADTHKTSVDATITKYQDDPDIVK